MGIIDRFEEEYVDVSSGRASLRDLLELVVGSILFVVGASAFTYYLLGRTTALAVAVALVVVFAITIVSQAYWGVTGRADYDEGERDNGAR
ncbi:hypothetical protein [Halopiger xanaduensis]|uniref:Uncharacterized protein n=1 Tax=Halopiger xanaduensis (strain DSM 18323 / JCM 14033 / SH-6) TaxID=797210 RepID=F8D3K0_HALXS|nr:hypothetical protein [Halopiger xanaduensis]AEH37365.1 hypothetical protein Halxa_2749 [Halopiger xanaduensis SH-6]